MTDVRSPTSAGKASAQGRTEAAAACRICGRDPIVPVLSLGRTPLANSLLTETQLGAPEPKYPLEVGVCTGCSGMQLLKTVPPEHMFSDYLYQSSFSDTMVRHAAEVADAVMQRQRPGADSLIVEIASNDGYLLQNFARSGVPVLGIDPAANIAPVAERKGVPTLSRFFSTAVATELAAAGRHADAILALNVLAHVPDVNDVVEGMRVLLKRGGICVIETPYVRDLVEHLEFDTIYHEHVFYYSLTALARLFGGHGLQIVSVKRVPIHGGSLQVWVAHEGAMSEDESVAALLREEHEWGVADLARYHRFAADVRELCSDLVSLLRELKSGGARIAAYGASAKGSTLLNYAGIGRDMLDFVVDRSTVKQGRYTPGTHLRIHAPERLLEVMPDYVLLLTWNFANEILAQQHEYRARGGRFITPLPKPGVIREAAVVAGANRRG